MGARHLLLGLLAFFIAVPGTAAAQGQDSSTQSSAQSGVCLDPEVIEPLTIEVACSEATSDSGGTDAEGSPAQILVIPINESTCPRTADELRGRPVGTDEENSGFGGGDEGGSVTLLSSACSTRTTPGQVSQGDASATVLEISGEPGSVTVAESSANTGYDSRRNAAVAASEASFALVQLNSEQGNVTVLECRSRTTDNPGRPPQTETESTLISADGQSEPDELDALTDQICALLVRTEAESGR